MTNSSGAVNAAGVAAGESVAGIVIDTGGPRAAFAIGVALLATGAALLRLRERTLVVDGSTARRLDGSTARRLDGSTTRTRDAAPATIEGIDGRSGPMARPVAAAGTTGD